jgi:hypothetical protein
MKKVKSAVRECLAVEASGHVHHARCSGYEEVQIPLSLDMIHRVHGTSMMRWFYSRKKIGEAKSCAEMIGRRLGC